MKPQQLEPRLLLLLLLLSDCVHSGSKMDGRPDALLRSSVKIRRPDRDGEPGVRRFTDPCKA